MERVVCGHRLPYAVQPCGRQEHSVVCSAKVKLSDFDYDLPPGLIAQEPPPERDSARMLVLHRDEGRWEDRRFRDLPDFLRKGDCLVVNDSRVLPSRLFSERREFEVMLLEPVTADA